MISNELSDFTNWRKWNSMIVREVPRKAGTYGFRLAEGQPIRRLRAESDILYFGCATNLQNRLKEHLNVRTVERNLGYYLHRVEREVGPVDVSWILFATPEEAKESERNLIIRYVVDHIEFPPFNRQESGKRIRMMEELVEGLAPGRGRELLERLKARAGLQR